MADIKHCVTETPHPGHGWEEPGPKYHVCIGTPEVLHFAPWGSPLTSCGKPVPRNLDTITDRRSETTCEDCRSRFQEER